MQPARWGAGVDRDGALRRASGRPDEDSLDTRSADASALPRASVAERSRDSRMDMFPTGHLAAAVPVCALPQRAPRAHNARARSGFGGPRPQQRPEKRARLPRGGRQGLSWRPRIGGIRLSTRVAAWIDQGPTVPAFL
ncbi:unnamed protein product [Prorocentrum cordatum]|uniref:Uncharacterized protein n=1 Tax=Prorocentrum cordatum TaxID=2364126 RepID=A0ABN9SFP6_9DINO|nr:unnamed protein product [Polarella glacialis]